tara:strand:+ start:215 stop:442 length:228 start_codon:yes stop_codon:yes gene_type:complete
MKTAIKPNLKTKTLFVNKSYSRLREKKTGFIDSKFYQKLFVVFISMSTILIFPESPTELENICENYNSRKLCNVW